MYQERGLHNRESQNDARSGASENAERKRSARTDSGLNHKNQKGLLRWLNRFFDEVEEQEQQGSFGLEIVVAYIIVAACMLLLSYLAMKLASYFYIL